MQAAKDKKPDLAEIAASIGKIKSAKLPPVHLWNPDFCCDLDIQIKQDGTWFYNQTPIGRQSLVQLFAKILRRDDDGRYYLVTPVEKVGIIVDDAPFLAIDFTLHGKGKGRVITFTTNVGDQVEIGPEHGLWVKENRQNGGLLPYIHIRARLHAKITRSMFYHLVETGQTEQQNGKELYGVWSQNLFFPLSETTLLDSELSKHERQFDKPPSSLP